MSRPESAIFESCVQIREVGKGLTERAKNGFGCTGFNSTCGC